VVRQISHRPHRLERPALRDDLSGVACTQVMSLLSKAGLDSDAVNKKGQTAARVRAPWKFASVSQKASQMGLRIVVKNDARISIYISGLCTDYGRNRCIW
jgi:hypothetical protein